MELAVEFAVAVVIAITMAITITVALTEWRVESTYKVSFQTVMAFQHSQSREDGNTPLDCKKEIVDALSLSTSLSRLSKVHLLALSSLLYNPLYWEDCTREDVKASEADGWWAMVVVVVVLVAGLPLEVVVVVVVEVIGDVVAMDVKP